jgi:hypothetical protein
LNSSECAFGNCARFLGIFGSESDVDRLRKKRVGMPTHHGRSVRSVNDGLCPTPAVRNTRREQLSWVDCGPSPVSSATARARWVQVIRSFPPVPGCAGIPIVSDFLTLLSGPHCLGSSPIPRLHDRRCLPGVGIFYTPNKPPPIITYWKQREPSSTASSTTVGISYTSTYRSLDGSLKPMENRHFSANASVA